MPGDDVWGEVMMGVLSGVKVLDATRLLAGPYSTLLLADFGADVLKIEKPQVGDPTRTSVFSINNIGAPFLLLNRNKRSCTINLKTPDGQDLFRQLARDADIVVESFRPGVMESWGLGYEDIRKIRKDVIYVSISGYGQTGPYRTRGGYDQIAQGLSGIMSVTGFPDRPPARAGVPVSDAATGVVAVIGVLGALRHREQTGNGCHVDTSLFDSAIAWSLMQIGEYLATGQDPEPEGSSHALTAPNQAFRTKDGYIMIAILRHRHWQALCNELGLPTLPKDARFVDNNRRLANREALAEILGEVLATRASAEWVSRLNARQVPCGPVNRYSEALADPQLRARELVVEQQHPEAGRILAMLPPLRMQPLRVEPAPAPRLGEHTDSVLASLGLSGAQVDDLRRQGVV